MSYVKVEVTGLEELEKLFYRVGDGFDKDDPIQQAGAVLLNRIRTRFLDETSPDGQRWPTSNAAVRRRQSGRGGGTLFDTGRLFHSIQVGKPQNGEVRIFTDVEYAPIHNEGRGIQEKREFMGFSSGDVEVAEKILLKSIERAIRG